ncbi:MAG TPA: formylglycine-generating enzyme family protein [Candidatus Obscuribacterales bacterium]
MTFGTLSVEEPKITFARERIEAFGQKFGTAHLYFAYHAAFPLAISPNLAYQLWGNFRRDINNESLNIPWEAVVDLLLSPLCDEVEAELYEMDLAVRTVLLNELKLDPKFGKIRLDKLSKFLLHYVEKQLWRKKSHLPDVAQLYEWIALAYIEPTEAAKKIASTLQEEDWQNQLELVRLASVIETFVEPLAEFEPLLSFSKAMGKYGRGDKEGAAKDFTKLGEEKQEVEIAGVRLQIPKFFTFETVTVNLQGEIIRQETKQARYFTEDLGNGVTLDMVYIPGGSFTMGAPKTEEPRDDERPQHQVMIPPFLLGKDPITQRQWQAVENLPKFHYDLNPNPSRFQGENRPVENVSWYDAIEFCARLSQKTGLHYRLPSEAEWEYACRAGTETPFHFGETITSELANYDCRYTYAEEPKGQERDETTPVGNFPFANNFGLYDMHGNIWEWCADPWHSSYEGAPTDGSVWDENNNNYQNYIDLLVNRQIDNRTRLLRGGSFTNPLGRCRAAYRYYIVSRNAFDFNIGFRVALTWMPKPGSHPPDSATKPCMKR